jgi:thioesterase domain-containing protein
MANFVLRDAGFRENLRLLDDHEMERYEGHTVLFVPRKAPFSRAPSLRGLVKRDFAWEPLCETLTVEVLDGDHFSMQLAENVHTFVVALRRHLS